MGFLSSLIAKTSNKKPDENSANLFVLRQGHDLKIVGESYRQDAIASVCGKKTEEGYNHVCVALLVPEPDNEYDKNAIMILVANMPEDGGTVDPKHVGYLDRENAVDYKSVINRVYKDGYIPACEARIVGGWDRENGDEGHYGVVLDLEEPKYAHPDDPPRKKSNSNKEVDVGVGTGSSRSSRSLAGVVRGKHYTEWVDTVKDLKRLGEYDSAKKLLLELCDACEAESKEDESVLSPWYFEQMAIICKKQNDYEGELAILLRYKQNELAIKGKFDARITNVKKQIEKSKTNP